MEMIILGFKIPFNEVTKKFEDAMLQIFPKNIQLTDIIFICIGTDRSTGDSLGPLIGKQLKELGYQNVYGSLDNPVHAINLKETLLLISSKHPGKKIIAFDACLGKVSSVGCIEIGNNPVRPGAGVNKDLGEVGDYSITGIVNVSGFMEYFVLQNTRLNLVFRMAEIIVNAIKFRFPLEVVNNGQSNPRRAEQTTINNGVGSLVEEAQMEYAYIREKINCRVTGD